MICSKNMTLTVNEPVAGDWWAMAEFSGNRIGSINATAIVPHGTAVQRVPGKIADGVLMNSVNGATDFSYFDSAKEAALAYDGNGLTAYGWIFFNAGDPAIQTMQLQWEFYNGATRVGLLGLDYNGFVGQWTVFVQSFPGGYDEKIVNFLPVNGSWVFYRAFYDPVLKQVGLQLNNGAVNLGTAGVVTLPTSATGMLATMNFRVNGVLGANSVILDEVALFIAFHSDTQAAFVYNSGNGRTWPFTLP